MNATLNFGNGSSVLQNLLCCSYFCSACFPSVPMTLRDFDARIPVSAAISGAKNTFEHMKPWNIYPSENHRLSHLVKKTDIQSVWDFSQSPNTRSLKNGHLEIMGKIKLILSWLHTFPSVLFFFFRWIFHDFPQLSNLSRIFHFTHGFLYSNPSEKQPGCRRPSHRW